MPQPPPRSDHTPKRLSRRLDRVFGEINPILLAVAIGLAVLDATCFSVIRLSDEFLRRISAGMENAWQLNAGRAVGLSSSGSTVSGESSAHTSAP